MTRFDKNFVLTRLVPVKSPSTRETAKRFAGSFRALSERKRERGRGRDDTGGDGDKHAGQASPCQILRCSGLASHSLSSVCFRFLVIWLIIGLHIENL